MEMVRMCFGKDMVNEHLPHPDNPLTLSTLPKKNAPLPLSRIPKRLYTKKSHIF